MLLRLIKRLFSKRRECNHSWRLDRSKQSSRAGGE